MSLTNFGELKEFCGILANSDLVPKDYRDKPGNCLVAVQMGGELGLSPMQSIQNIAVINGRPALWGDAMLALCETHPDYVDTVETFDEATQTAKCVAKRRGRSDKVHTFSWDDAIKAKLDKKDTYQNYRRRMLQQRARGFALRDQWAGVLKGLVSAEEVQDYPAPTRAVHAEVTSSKTVEEPQPETKPEPPKATQPVARFAISFPVKEWADKPLADAPAEALADYIAWLEAVLGDRSRQRLHKKAQESKAEAEAVYNARVEAEMDKPQATQPQPLESDPIAEGLQAAHDATHAAPAESATDGWGLAP